MSFKVFLASISRRYFLVDVSQGFCCRCLLRLFFDRHQVSFLTDINQGFFVDVKQDFFFPTSIRIFLADIDCKSSSIDIGKKTQLTSTKIFPQLTSIGKTLIDVNKKYLQSALTKRNSHGRCWPMSAKKIQSTSTKIQSRLMLAKKY